MPDHADERKLVLSYLVLRKAVGILGMSLTFLVVLGGVIFGSGGVEKSISAYYGTNMRDAVVGILMIIGAFLVSYKGYDLGDKIFALIAGFAAMGIALFPFQYICTAPNIFGIHDPTVHNMHMAFATIFFTTLALMSLIQFPKGDTSQPKKKKRNIIYYSCGTVILICLVILFFYFLLFNGTRKHFILIFEAIMFLAFGISWLVKGQGLIKD